jgi:hypothetical protein
MRRRPVHHLRMHCLVGLGLVALAGALLAGPAMADPGSNNASDQAKSHATSGNAGTSGDPNSPQPNSNADNNGVGANNGPGPYTSTRDGSPSGNGSGTGNATGEPCAGCVGKADNKNPPGQMPGPSDANAGYECDTNHGIAQTNPAHTGCAEVSGGTETPPGGTETPPGGTETPPCDTATTNCAPCVPSASNNNCAEVAGEQIVQTSASAPTEVLAESTTQVEATSLAATGIDVGDLLVIAMALLLTGTALIAFARLVQQPRARAMTMC